MLKTDEFIKLYGEEIFEEIFECQWNRKNSERVTITENIMRNAANYYFSGHFVFNDKEINFDAESGDYNGSQILSFGEYAKGFDDYKQSRYVFSPKTKTEFSDKIFSLWKKEAWFIKKENDMNYDFMFDPSGKTKKHYRDFAESKGMVIEIEGEA